MGEEPKRETSREEMVVALDAAESAMLISYRREHAAIYAKNLHHADLIPLLEQVLGQLRQLEGVQSITE